jgi:hypothetical protein
MAQTVFLNCTADKSASRKVDVKDHKNSAASVSAAASGDITVSYDPAVITTLTMFDSAIATLRQLAISAGLK